MKIPSALVLTLVGVVVIVVVFGACSSESEVGPAPLEGFIPGPDVDLDHPPAASDETADESSAEDVDGGGVAVQGAPKADGGGAATNCKKKLTIIFTVGVPGKSKIQSNGCWTPVITDGAAVSSYRKCSTSSFNVTNNPAAPNWAYDDTNPQHALAAEKTFLAKCANGSTGDGWEFMAYRGGWRMLAAPNLRAYFAELYGSATTDIDSLYAVNGVYKNNAGLAGKINVSVWPMINFGPPAGANLHAKVGAEIAKICKTLPNNGYFGMYNATWPDGMDANDKRLVALEKALDTCTSAN